jgi:hypothetical protein
LYGKVYRADILSHAYALVRANKGSAGIDGVTFTAIEEREGDTAFIAELEEALRSKTYKPDPVKRVMIPRADGSQRPLGIPIYETGWLRWPSSWSSSGHSCRLTGWSKKSTRPCGDGAATFTIAIAAMPLNMFGVTSSSECVRI